MHKWHVSMYNDYKPILGRKERERDTQRDRSIDRLLDRQIEKEREKQRGRNRDREKLGLVGVSICNQYHVTNSMLMRPRRFFPSFNRIIKLVIRKRSTLCFGQKKRRDFIYLSVLIAFCCC